MGKLIGFDSGDLKGVDPRVVDIITAAAKASPYDVQLTDGMRSGGKGNHKRGYAIDVRLVDNGRELPNKVFTKNSKGEITGLIAGATEAYPAYEQLAQLARTYQTQNYPELNNTFRWGGGFKQGGTPIDMMHFDITPGQHGSMAYYDWDTGAKGGVLDAVSRFGGTITSNGGLGGPNGSRLVAQYQQQLAGSGGLVPPGSIEDIHDRQATAQGYGALPPIPRPRSLADAARGIAPPFPLPMPPSIREARQRVASLDAPATVPTVPNAAPKFAALPNGKQVEVGKLYTFGGESYRGAVDPSGVGRFEKIPGSIFGEAGKNTVVGGAIGKAVGSAVDEGTRRIAVAAPALASGAQKMASDAAAGVGGFFSDLFGGKPKPSVPALPRAPSAQPGMLGRGQPAPQPTPAPLPRSPSVQPGMFGRGQPAPPTLPQSPSFQPGMLGRGTAVAQAPSPPSFQPGMMGRGLPTPPAAPAPAIAPPKPAPLPTIIPPIPATMSPGLRDKPDPLGDAIKGWWNQTLLGRGVNFLSGQPQAPFQGGGLLDLMGTVFSPANHAQISANVARQAKIDPGGFAIGQANRKSPNPSYDVSGGNNSFNPASVQNSARWQTGY